MSADSSDDPELAGRSARELFVPLGIAALVMAVAARSGPRVFDDAYITFRYARNLAAGHGFVYNPGESVLGTSSPLWGALLAATAKLGCDIPRAAFVLSALALALTAVFGWRLLRLSVPPLLAAAALAAALAAPHTAAVFASGMETPLYLLLVVLAAWLLGRRRDRLALALAGLVPFVHPDGILLFPAVAIALAWRDRRWPWRESLAGAVPALVLAAALTARFGSPVPQSVRAKAATYPTPAGTAFAALAETVVHAVAPVPAAPPGLGPVGVAVELLAVLVIAALALRTAASRPSLAPPFVALALFAVGLLLAFGLANPFLFEWYDPPLVLAALLPLAAAAAGAGPRVATTWGVLFACAALLHLVRFAPYDPSDREDLYRRAAEDLALGPTDLVAAPEIGALGWATRARVLDTQGLVSPEALRVRRAAGGGPFDGSVPPAVLKELAPPHLVALDRFLAGTLAASPDALAGYREVAFYPSSRWGSRGVHVYRRSAP